MSRVIVGLHAVEAILKQHPEQIEQIWCDSSRKDKRLQVVQTLAQRFEVRLQLCDKKTLDQQSPNDRHQGVVAIVKGEAIHNESYLEELITRLDRPPFLLVLDGVQDPHNLGACLRSADAAGVDAVIAPKDRACGLTATVSKVASGAAETVPLIHVTNLARTLRMLQDNGVWVVGTSLEGAQGDLYQADLTGPLAIVLGAEGSGIRRLTAEVCDSLIYIPMRGSVESLNVSVATGVCLFEAARQRMVIR